MSDSNVNFGVLLPTREAVMSGRSDPTALFELAERAEALGFHSVWVGDSLTARPRIDALTTLAALGARTLRGRDPSARMKMSEELVQVMRRLWRENDVSHAGQFTRFEHVTLEPKPVQPGGVPIWLASNDIEPGLRGAGKWAGAW